ncbi:MAG: hypothetical protein C0594_11655 [Marinilabiliales bacterium]|nr:MAG: hypothetical protein C0594_11655 [Marinilabiliales bacterium]
MYVTAKIIEKKAEYTFTDLSSGKYSVLVYHDENKSLTLDKYFFGMPKEGIGATQNPSHIPSFENTSFMLDKSLLAKVLMTYL